MSTAINQEPDRRQRTSSLIKELERERQQVWSLYCKIADLKPFLPGKNFKPVLTEFSQMLIDYIS
jgi:regulator of sigma D